MKLIPWRNKRRENDGANHSLARFGETIENVFDRFWEDPFGTALPATTHGLSNWGPPLELSETDREVVARFELPGLKANDIDVNVCGQALTIRGQKRSEREEKSRGGYQYSERHFGEFARRITLPSRVDPQRVKATYRDGVLTVVCQKNPSTQARRVQVNAVDEPVKALGSS